ncbi:MAG TPA: hypothetical protein VMZ91_01620 [Candidatus Paceibacterota bacterium]|nr:hypothetical protein [Candidatus Paceibacterota bacterium]
MLKHNKKRNTAFLYEVLVTEIAKCVLEKNNTKKDIVISIVKEHFARGYPLWSELIIYNDIISSVSLKENLAKSVLQEAKLQHKKLNKKEIFNQQTQLINKINLNLNGEVFDNFVKNYKMIATINQVLENQQISPKERVLLEEKILSMMIKESSTKQENTVEHIDKIVFNKFLEKFNEKYGKELIEEQKNLLKNYIYSNSANSLNFQMFLAKEISSIKDKLQKAMKKSFLSENLDLKEKTAKVLTIIEEMKTRKVDSKMIEDLLKVYELIHELDSNE